MLNSRLIEPMTQFNTTLERIKSQIESDPDISSTQKSAFLKEHTKLLTAASTFFNGEFNFNTLQTFNCNIETFINDAQNGFKREPGFWNDVFRMPFGGLLVIVTLGLSLFNKPFVDYFFSSETKIQRIWNDCNIKQTLLGDTSKGEAGIIRNMKTILTSQQAANVNALLKFERGRERSVSTAAVCDFDTTFGPIEILHAAKEGDDKAILALVKFKWVGKQN